jgi:hypothetical protein
VLSSDSQEIIAAEWNGVELMLDRMRKISVGSFGSLGGVGVPKVVYNLPLLLSTDVLCQALKKASEESLFECRRSNLGALIRASENALSWEDWDNIIHIVTERNKIAHDGELFEAEFCINSIASIKKQLELWQVL